MEEYSNYWGEFWLISDGQFVLLFIGSCIAVGLVIKLYRKSQGSEESIRVEDTYPLAALIAFLIIPLLVILFF